MNIKKVMDKMNYNYGNPNGKSDLGDIQNMMTEWFYENLTKSSLSMEASKTMMDNFEANIFDNPDMFDSSIDYSSIRGCKHFFNEKKANYGMYLNEQNENKMRL